MLAHCKEMMEYQNGLMTIHPRFNKLTTALRTAIEIGEGVLDKDTISFDDSFDSFRLSLMFWNWLLLFGSFEECSWIKDHLNRTYFPIVIDMIPHTHKLRIQLVENADIVAICELLLDVKFD
jgi:hypothetical protein